MIIRKNFDWRIILGYSRYMLALSVTASLSAVLTEPFIHALPYPVIGTFGTALAIFVAFRNNSSYDRWWEARKTWGAVVNASRTWGRQVTSLVEAPRGTR